MNKLLLLLFLSLTIYAKPYTKQSILGVWEVSSKKINGFTTFGKDFSTTRGESYILVFNKKGLVKNKNTGSIYNYEIIQGKLKIYETKTYRNNYKVKDKVRFDLWEMSAYFENCPTAKIITKKMMGYYNKKRAYKWCKIEDYPQATFQTDIENYRF